jgi:hypothetical protein
MSGKHLRALLLATLLSLSLAFSMALLPAPPNVLAVACGSTTGGGG